MAVSITIRDVPSKVRDELAARATRQGRSMQEFLRAELERLVKKPSPEGWLAAVRERKADSARRLGAKEILRLRDADRR